MENGLMASPSLRMTLSLLTTAFCTPNSPRVTRTCSISSRMQSSSIRQRFLKTRMFLNGQLHLTYTIPADFIPTALSKYSDFIRQETYISTTLIRTNTNREFTANPLVRQALSLSIDRKSLIDNVLQGGQKPAGAITPPFGSYQPEFKTAFNPERARKLLKEAGYGVENKLPQIELLVRDRESSVRIAEALQALWRKHLELKVRIIKREAKSYFAMRKKLEFDLIAGPWTGDYLDPTTFLDLWKASNGNNHTGWGDSKYDSLLAEAEMIDDPEVRYRKLLEAESYIMDHMPAIPLYHSNTNYFISSNVKNWYPLLLNYHPYKFVEFQK